MNPQIAQYLPLLVAVPVVALIVWMNRKPRRLHVERMWVRPVILIALAAVVFWQYPPSIPVGAAICAGLAIVGAGLGWLRGKAMRITVEPDTHIAMMQSSPWGIALILGLFVVRIGLRSMIASGAVHANINQVTDALLALVIGLVVAQGLEMWIRARRLIEESRAAAASRAP